MELKMDFKEGNLITNSKTGDFYLVLFKTLYNVVLLKFNYDIINKPYSVWSNSLPLFIWKNYDLANKDDIEKLNEDFQTTSISNVLANYAKVYGVEIGSIVEYDYKQMMLLGKTERKILTFTIIRPVLFDFNKAKEKYIVFDRLAKLNELQASYDSEWSQYLITPFASEENIVWDVVRDRLPFEELINKTFIENEFANKPTNKIDILDFYKVINYDKLNLIENEDIKEQIIKLIKQTLIIAKENESIGIKSEPRKPKEDESKFTIEFTYKLNASDRDVLTVNHDIFAIDEVDALNKAQGEFYDLYEGKNYDLISISLAEDNLQKEPDEPISTIDKPTTKLVKLSNLKRGDRFSFPLSQEDLDMGVSNEIYVFQEKAKSTFFYKRGDDDFYSSENREVNLLPSVEEQKNKVAETTPIEVPLSEEEELEILNNLLMSTMQ